MTAAAGCMDRITDLQYNKIDNRDDRVGVKRTGKTLVCSRNFFQDAGGYMNYDFSW